MSFQKSSTAELTAEQFALRAFDASVLSDRELSHLWAELGSRTIRLEKFKRLATRHGLLTNYQTDRLLRGEKDGYFFGDYKILYLIGEGSFARVFRAVHRETGEVVAIKALRKSRLTDVELSGQFYREGVVGSSLRHPNIVPIYEAVSDEKDGNYLVMEFLEGHTLREFMRIRSKLEVVEAVRLMIDILSGLSYAFDRGVTHRDLSLSNVLVSADARAKLADFGLAAIAYDADDIFINKAPNPRTIDYVALERASHVRKNDARSDIFFVGCIFYQMLSGEPALEETKDRLARLNTGRFGEIILLKERDPEIPDWIVTIVQRAMSIDANERYQKPSEMLADLKKVLRRLTLPGIAGDGLDGQTPGQLQHTVMVIESNSRLQDIFRKALKESGYRVLVTSNPLRALARFEQDRQTAECVLFSTADLGQPALEVFNEFGQNEATKGIPAALLLDEKHDDWLPDAELADHRRVARMPISVAQLRELLLQLISSSPSEE